MLFASRIPRKCREQELERAGCGPTAKSKQRKQREPRLLTRILPRRDRAYCLAIDVVDGRDQRRFVLGHVITAAGLLHGGAPLRVGNAFAEVLLVVGADEIERDLVVDG